MKNFDLTRNYLQQGQEIPNYYGGRVQPQQYDLNQIQQLLQQMNDYRQNNQEQQYNPFNTGISNAINSARSSLGMTSDQEGKALRKAALTFGAAIGQEPKRKGFFANFGAVGRALSPAILTHDEAEEEAITQNNNLANQILSYQAQQEALARAEEEKAYNREWEREKFKEQKRHHDTLEHYKWLKAQGNNGLSEQELKDYLKEKTESANTLEVINQLEQDYKRLGNLDIGWNDKQGFLGFGELNAKGSKKNITAETAKKLFKEYGLELNRKEPADFSEKLNKIKETEQEKLRRINIGLEFRVKPSDLSKVISDQAANNSSHSDIVLVKSRNSGEVIPILRSNTNCNK